MPPATGVCAVRPVSSWSTKYGHLMLRQYGDRPRAADQARAVWRLCTLHDATVDDLRRAVQLFECTSLGGRDTMHAATALTDYIVGRV